MRQGRRSFDDVRLRDQVLNEVSTDPHPDRAEAARLAVAEWAGDPDADLVECAHESASDEIEAAFSGYVYARILDGSRKVFVRVNWGDRQAGSHGWATVSAVLG
ncbi:hypothetical protein GGR19_002964 [Croceicoccus naphthovorans]|uniref:hypothetical protein n=1 Tax=Croceicoccus naphthovorans TaxID=1348774 RepID=UPI0012E09BC3|nr:hypothetical protein [Croceicoccus naphthovorans]MBB3991526.1 hypothetical protein [Croceicoccus naphthovorans]